MAGPLGGRRVQARRRFIESYDFSPALRSTLRRELGDDHKAGVALEGLRVWYLACLYADGGLIGMPSKAVDEAWHQMILFTREYARFCEQAFGRFLHHSPESTLETSMDKLLARTVAIVDEHGLSELLFTADAEAGLEDGSSWSADELRRLRDSNGVAFQTPKRRKGRGGGDGGCGADLGGDGGGDGGGGCGGGCGGGG